MVKVFSGDLVLRKDTVFNESIVVKGKIVCKRDVYDLTVNGDISAMDIYVGNIKARDINALDIIAHNIDARDIYVLNIDVLNINAENISAKFIEAVDIIARDIYADFIICSSRIKKSKNCKTIAFFAMTDRYHRKRKEVMPEKGKGV